MEKLPVFITAQPSDLYYAFEVETQINNFKRLGYSHRMHILVYEPDETPDRLRNRVYWDKLQERHPEVTIRIYKDKGVRNFMGTYIPVLRPHILAQHFKLYPELSQETIFYHDADILFTKKLDFSQFMQEGDDKCYLSDTNGYINAAYFDSKTRDVLPEKLEQYKKLDILDNCCKIVGIDRATAEANMMNSGGAQYLIKNVDHKFWEKVQNDCISIRIYLMSINRQFFANENAGFQSWCADMWAVLWNLWLLNKETACPPELNFCWATNTVNNWETHYIFHNAGVTPDRKFHHAGKEHTLFYKGDPRFKQNQISPFDLPPTEFDNISQDFCSYKYVQEFLDVKDPIAKKNT